MKIEQEKTFAPVIVTLETEAEYNAMALIMDDFADTRVLNPNFHKYGALQLAGELNDFFTNNVT